MGLLDSPVEPIAVLGGDFTYAAYQPASKTLVLAPAGGPRIEQPLRDLVASIELTTEERAGIGPGLGWGVAGALVAGPFGALAGALIAPRLFLDVNFMGSVLIYSFAAATLGGFDSPFGAVLGGWIIGIAENLAGTYVDFIGADLKILVPLLAILLVLLFRPTGMFGSAEVARA